MEPSLDWQTLTRSLALAIPMVMISAALLGPLTAPFRAASIASWVAAGLSVLVALGTLVSPEAAPGATLIRLDFVTCVMLLLVAGMGVAVVRYSVSYLAGDPGAQRYAGWLMATLAAVSTLVVANNLLLLAFAWTSTSLALHQLLTFYDRPAAIVAAHKKFLASRFADLCLLIGLGLTYSTIGSLNLDAIQAWVAGREGLPVAVHLAAFLFALGACVKCAQIPLHGWLTQVMEAPTPVSALLHAGVVNIGGFLMIRLAALMAAAPVAQTFLVVVGMVSVVLGALVMTTRVSIKVALAWSTCAQMGLMLVQCGLGAWDLALLHLVAHSLYKAHSFLSSGSTVEAWRIESLLPTRRPETLAQIVWVAAIVLGLFGVGLLVAEAVPVIGGSVDLTTRLFALVAALSLVPMWARALSVGGAATRTIALQGAGVVALYFGWHLVVGRLLGVPDAQPTLLAWSVVAAGFAALFVVQAALQALPESAFAHRLHRWLFAGLYLDERFTRLTFRLWPPRAPARA